MGATESAFYDDAPLETAHPDVTSLSMPIPPPSHHPRSPPSRDGDPEARLRRNPQPQPYPRQPQSQKPKAPPTPRRRPPAPAKPIKRMEGLVLGGPQTGKRTLLSRLKGVDPFANNDPTTTTTKSANPVEDQEPNPSIIIQYKPPSESPTWDRIKLRIRYANAIGEDTQTKSGNNIDFVVLLTSPKDSRETTQSYLENLLDTYLDRLGYHTTTSEGGDERHGEDGKRVTEPFCIALLFNFRDLQDAQKNSNDETDSAPASMADLRRLVQETIRSRNVLPRKVVVELLETSLLNCYGLDGLHRFIYRTYLQRCQTDLEKQLEVIQTQMRLTDHQHNHHHPPTDGDKNPATAHQTMAYDEFLKEIAPVESPPPEEGEPSTDSLTKDTQPQEDEPLRRLTMPQQSSRNKQPASSLRMGKDALEAFLASSSDEEEDAKQPQRQPQPIARRNRFPNPARVSSGYSSSSDEDSDDDFFYDESGNRRHHVIDQTTTTKPTSRTEALDNNNTDGSSSSSSSSDTEEEAANIPSPSKASSENQNPMQHTENESPTRQPTMVTDKDTRANKDKGHNDEATEDTEKETTIQAVEIAETSTVEEENQLVDEEYDSTADVARIETDENVPKGESSLESRVDSTGDGENEEREVDDDGDNSCGETDRNANDDVVGTLNPDSDSSNEHNIVVDSHGENTVNVENDDDISPPTNLPLNTNDNANDDNDDNDDGHMIHSTPTMEEVKNKNQDDNNDDDDDDDDDDDGFMINSTPAAGKNVEDSDDDDDHYMINSTPAPGNVVEDSDDDDDYMINPTPDVGNVVEDSDDDGDDDDFMINSTPDVGKVAEDSDDDDDDDYMINPTPDVGNVVEGNADGDGDEMNSTPAVVQKVRQDSHDDDGSNDDDDDDFMIHSTPAAGNEDEDEGDFVIRNLPAKDSSQMAAEDDDDSDTGFVIRSNPVDHDDPDNQPTETAASRDGSFSGSHRAEDERLPSPPNEPSRSPPLAATHQVSNSTAPPPPPTSQPSASGGISQAALAAIAAAQQEAEAMMRQQQQLRQQEYSQLPSSAMKEKKSKKKKKDEKKKKKKKKSKGMEDG